MLKKLPRLQSRKSKDLTAAAEQAQVHDLYIYSQCWESCGLHLETLLPRLCSTARQLGALLHLTVGSRAAGILDQTT